MSTLQIFSFIFTIFDLFLLIILYKMYVNSRIYLGQAMIYLLHILFFYIVLALEHAGLFIKPYQFLFSEWSALLRLHGSIALMFTLLYLVKWKAVIKKLNSIRQLIRG